MNKFEFERQRECQLEAEYGNSMLPAGSPERAQTDFDINEKLRELLDCEKKRIEALKGYTTLYVDRGRPARGQDAAVDQSAENLELLTVQGNALSSEFHELLAKLFSGNKLYAYSYFTKKFEPLLKAVRFT